MKNEIKYFEKYTSKHIKCKMQINYKKTNKNIAKIKQKFKNK